MKFVKEHVHYLLEWNTSGQPWQDYIWTRRGESKNEWKLYNSKLIERLLLIITVVDPKRFNLKGKSFIYIEAFAKHYNWKNCRRVLEIDDMIKLENINASTVETLCNLGAYEVIEISLLLCSIYMIPRDYNRIMFYINNSIDWDKFNYLYGFGYIEKGIKNADTIISKLGFACTRITNYRLMVLREEE